MSTRDPSGVDLARVAFTAARQAAQQHGTDGGPLALRPKRLSRPLPRDGRDPMGLGAALTRLMAERGWQAPAAGGSVLENWDVIASADFAGPDFPQHVHAVGFDADTGLLELLPDSSAWGTQARLIAGHLIARANEHVGDADRLVRGIQVLSPGHAAHRTLPEQPTAGPTGQAPTADRLARSNPPDGYRQAKAHLAASRSPRTDPEATAALRRQPPSPRFREPAGVFAAVIARSNNTPIAAQAETPR